MTKYNKITPEGMSDILFKNADAKRDIENKITCVFKKRGYGEVITPTLEFYDVFDNSENSLPQEKAYKLFDSKGRILVLRPDMTAPMLRVCATKLDQKYLPYKLFSKQQVFRCNEYLNAKSDEITQCGVEIIGAKGIKADIEVIVSAIKALEACGLNDFKIELGHIGFFKELAKLVFDSDEKIDTARQLIEKKNFAELDMWLEDFDKESSHIKALKRLPLLFGGVEVFDEASSLASSKAASEIIKFLRDIYDQLCSMGYSKYLFIDLGMVHSMNYYTGLIFRGFIEGYGDTVLSGGRYDNLGKNFGLDLSSTGFAISVDSILDVYIKYNNTLKQGKKVLIHYQQGCLDKANKLLSELSQSGIRAEISLFDNLEESKNYQQVNTIDEIYLVTVSDIKVI